MERHCDNAERVVEHLASRTRRSSEVYYPGLPEHPGHDARGQADAPASAAWCRITVDGGERAAVAVCGATQIWTLGESLGGVESLIEHPARMTHASVCRHTARGASRPRPAVRGHRGRRRPDRRPRRGTQRPRLAMTIVAWERADEARGHSVARVEERPDGWLFHGSEVLVGDETLSCTFSVVVGADWVTRHVEAIALSAAGETRRVLEAVDGRWTVDGAARPDLDGCVDVDIAATPLTNTFPIRRLAHLEVGEQATSGVAWVDVPALGVTRVDQTYERLGDRGRAGPLAVQRPAPRCASSSPSTPRGWSSTTRGSPDAYRLSAGRDDGVRPALPRRRLDVHQGGPGRCRRRRARDGGDADDPRHRRPRRLPCCWPRRLGAGDDTTRWPAPARAAGCGWRWWGTSGR